MSAHATIPKVGTLVSVWATLIVLTALTSAASYIDIGEWNIVLALLIAVTKASLVVWIFMGVRYVTTLTRLFVVAGLVWLFIMILITSSDYTTRAWTYQPKPWADNPAHGLSR
ncbi:MAG: cytochrome C oxidase subunit IV family protein [Acidobacteriaceae bacterium]|nr:cytochrome C oxidase subunit IV family protein [Acidobacteriaceae bacterium]